jgi:hypothetical protein
MVLRTAFLTALEIGGYLSRTLADFLVMASLADDGAPLLDRADDQLPRTDAKA